MADAGNTPNNNKMSTTCSALSSELQKLLQQALHNLLSTDIARHTLAQIVDGVPLPSTLEDTWGGLDLEPDHPLFAHKSLCPGILAKTEELLRTFEVKDLTFESSVGNG